MRKWEKFVLFGDDTHVHCVCCSRSHAVYESERERGMLDLGEGYLA